MKRGVWKQILALTLAVCLMVGGTGMIEVNATPETSDTVDSDTEEDSKAEEEKEENPENLTEEQEFAEDDIVDLNAQEAQPEEQISQEETKPDTEPEIEDDEVMTASEDLSDVILQSGGLLEEEEEAKTQPLSDTTENERREYLEQMLTEAWLSCTSCNLDSSYGITKDDLSAVYTDLLNHDYRFFYVKSSYGYSYTLNNVIIKVSPQYYYSTAEEASAHLETLETEIDKALRGAEDSWSDLEKVLYVNDYLARNCEYDTAFAGDMMYSAYGALVDKKAVCQGYSLAYLALIEKLGVPCELVTSNSLNHAWNIVYVNGSYYHEDVTWNDPTADLLGRARHLYLMKSSECFSSDANKHAATDWVFSGNITSASASDTTYDDYFWDDSDTGFEYINGIWYGVVDSTINSYTCNGSKFTQKSTIKEIKDKWYTWGSTSGYYTGCYTSLASAENRLYYSLPSAVYVYDPNDGTDVIEYTLSSDFASQGYIYGMRIDADEEMDIYLATSPNSGGGVGIYAIEVLDHTHTLKEYPATDATCTKEGNIAYWYCKRCGKYFSDEKAVAEITRESTVVAALGHDYKVIETKDATAKEDGYEKYECTRCRDSYTETIPALGPTDISDAVIKLDTNSYVYDGTAKEPSVTVTYGSKTLTAGTDYTVTYSNNTNVGTAKVTINGIEDYTGTVTATFTITKASQTVTVTAKATSIAVDETITITVSGEGTISYKSSDTSVATVSSSGVVTGVGTGTTTITVTAAGNDNYNSASTTISIEVTKANQTVSASAKASSIAVDSTTTITVSGKGTISYKSSNTSIATVSSSGVVTGVGTGTATITVTAAGNDNYNSASTTLSITVTKASQTVTASAKSSSIVVGKTTTITASGKGSITYSSSNTKIATVNSSGKVTAKSPGKVTITVKAAGNSSYNSASKKVTITVKPKATKLSSVKNKSSKKAVIKWKKVSGVTGYQIQYSTSKTFKSGNKSATVKGASKVSKTISKLKKGKTYYFRVRTYKTVSGTKYYSSWSSAKKVKIKK